MSKKDKKLSIRAGEKLYLALAEYAVKNRTTISGLVWSALAAHYKDLREEIIEDRI